MRDRYLCPSQCAIFQNTTWSIRRNTYAVKATASTHRGSDPLGRQGQAGGASHLALEGWRADRPGGPSASLKTGTVRTDEETLDLVRRLATFYPDPVIAGILNRQGRSTARGHRFEANRVATLRKNWRIPCFQPNPEGAEGEVLAIAPAATALNVAPSTLHRWLNDGLYPASKSPRVHWRIRLTAELKARFTEVAGEGFVTMQEATRALGVTRQTVLHRVKRGEIKAAHVTKGRKIGLRIKIIDHQIKLFEPTY